MTESWLRWVFQRCVEDLVKHLQWKIKLSKPGNEIDNRNREIMKSLERELKFLKQENANKNKLVILHTSKVFGSNKDNNGNDFDLDTNLSTFKSKLSDEIIDIYNNIFDSSVVKTINLLSKFINTSSWYKVKSTTKENTSGKRWATSSPKKTTLRDLQ